MRLHKKGYGVADIAPMAIMLGLAIVVTVVMAQVTENVQDGYVTGAAGCNSTSGLTCGYAYNISQSGLEGLDELGSWFDIVSA